MLRLVFLVLLLHGALWGQSVQAKDMAGTLISLEAAWPTPIGRHARVLQDPGGQLGLAEVIGMSERFSAGGAEVLSFGIGPAPVWIWLRLENPTSAPQPRHLSVETSWLDQVDLYLLHGGQTVARFRTGDRMPFPDRPIAATGFSFEHDFAPGITDVYLRIETPDPMVVPIYLETAAEYVARHLSQAYSYGLLYGFMLALALYNLMLFVGLRRPRYLFYAVYLGAFLLMNFSYTGHAFALLWPMQPVWNQWAQPILMTAFAVSGLIFAMSFLQTRSHFPRAHRLVIGFCLGGVGLLAVAIVLGQQREALLLAFSFVTLFTLIMVALGIMAVHARVGAARYFLAASLFAMAGAATTAMAVWGMIDFSVWTYRAVDIGMMIDATLLALALTYQFREAMQQREQAEQLARVDPLTGVHNRRAFHEAARSLWTHARRGKRPLSVILLDLDHFKQINDRFGHDVGDQALTRVAALLREHSREQDLLARWGGEEFILLLPETDLRRAGELAGRLRRFVAKTRLKTSGGPVRLTASFGLAGASNQTETLEQLITLADHGLYQAKAAGRNCIRAVQNDLADNVELPGRAD